MKAVAFANNDIAVVAWTFGGKLDGCVGFSVYRIDVHAGTETCLPALATFEGQEAKPGRTTADDPVQKFFWRDVYARRGGLYRYKVVPMTGTPGDLRPMPYGPLLSNPVHLSPDHGILSVYFNRGILATQSTAHALTEGGSGGSLQEALEAHIQTPGDALRADLAGQMVEALTALPREAAAGGGELYCALYELQDPEVLQALEALGGSLNVVLSNMPGKGADGEKTDDTYAAQRQAMKDVGARVIDRFMPSGHIGHNKFQVLVKGDPQAVTFGSTNITSHALCAQTNNSILARSPAMAAAYRAYWGRLVDDTEGGRARQAEALRAADGGAATIALEDGSGSVDLWFSPSTPRARQRAHGATEPTPPDLAQVFQLIAAARQAILFLAFQPGSPSVVDAIAQALSARPSLFVRGAVTDAGAAGEFYTALHGGAARAPRRSGEAPPPEDARVIHAQGMSRDDVFGQWEAELSRAGHAVIHDKIVVVDPFSDGCVVVTGSHNLGYQASYDNDENLAIIRGHRAVAEAYAAHCLDVYDHYAWRYWLAKEKDRAWHFLSADDRWQDDYFTAQNEVKSAELAFWLGATPSTDALPILIPDASTRSQPALQAVTGGTSPAVGPHSATPHPRTQRGR